MKTIQITEANALKAYDSTDSTGRALLADLIGADFFNRKITDRVKTLEDALELSTYKPSWTEDDAPDDVAYKQLKAIVNALNEGWTPDLTDDEQYWYWPYFSKTSKGFVFFNVHYYSSLTNLSSRLCFRSREVAQYAAETFHDLYRDYYLIAD